jgi:hypothetical protein
MEYIFTKHDKCATYFHEPGIFNNLLEKIELIFIGQACFASLHVG